MTHLALLNFLKGGFKGYSNCFLSFFQCLIQYFYIFGLNRKERVIILIPQRYSRQEHYILCLLSTLMIR